MEKRMPSPALLAVIDRLEWIGRQLELDGWTCDGGAGALQLLCERAGIYAELCVGLYYWPQERLAEKWELLEGGEPDEASLADYWRDEHHHWIEAEGLVLDSNGEIRGEPRWQLASDAYDTARAGYYEPYELGAWGAWDKVFSWSPYSGFDDDGEPVLHSPREAATWMKEIERALALVDAFEIAGRT